MAHPGYLIALATVCISLGCASEPVPQLVPDNVSMVQIITSPDEYVGEVISVSGFLTDHGDMLFLSSDHYQLMDIASMIYVRIAYKEEDKVSGSTRYSTSAFVASAACTRIRTSSSFGMGFFTSLSCRTSGDP